ncbi:hypothetical protein ANCCEY_05170 [Ancylostoma ceylanicum]|uniref:SCP domain-containing protein n=1 Tax=Ancylostoma ceylanicum TaxID=53326 RepID=A0A0D6M767_9BILA|nr:hypothetical protein ANCCEY_05170 [Ancylostoma ceylanicum]
MPGYDCILEGIARIELDRSTPSNLCTGVGKVITEKFEDAKIPGYKPKDFIAKAVKSFYDSIGKMGVTGQFGCNYAADETKYRIACVFQGVLIFFYASDSPTSTEIAPVMDRWPHCMDGTSEEARLCKLYM